MKKLIYISLALGILSCNDTEKKAAKTEEIKTDYVTISGIISNLKEGDLTIQNYFGDFSKTISVNKDGSLKDTLKVPDTIVSYFLMYGEEYTDIFLQNGDNISFTLDTKEFDESLFFEGNTARENNYLAQKNLAQKIDFMALISAENQNFEKEFKSIVEEREAYLNKNLDLNQKLIEAEKESIENFKEGAIQYHDQAVEKAKVLAELTGKPSPKFINYKTPEGKLVSLDQFKGKYTYIDIWATWCGPCKAEIPDMITFNNTEEANKINFISLSVDEEKAIEEWKKMVVEKEMTWHQLRADSAWNSDFIKAYSVNSIPRFILLDPKGNVVNPDAPRPSSEEFKTMIADLNL